MSERLPATTSMGRVALTVSNLAQSLTFYREQLGFEVLEQGAASATLGAGDLPLLELQERAGAQRPRRATTGLYHFAILLPSRRHLAEILHHLAASGAALQGAADHFVSEALYLADPDGNGIELYRDRPRDEWPYRGEQLQIGTAPLDVDGLLAEVREENRSWTGLPAGTTIGHVHLQVANLQAAEAFYREVIGFDLMMHYGASAAFLAAGGYHHHLGLNTWAGRGVPAAPEGATGLQWYEIRTPAEGMASILERAQKAELAPREEDGSWLLVDPAHIKVRLTPA